MEVGEFKPIGVKIRGVKLIEFFDEKFLGLLSKEMENAKIEHFCLTVKENDKERGIVIDHDTKEDEENEIIAIKTRNVDDLDKVLNIIKTYIK